MKKNQQNTLISPSIDELMEKVDNKYVLSLLIAKRARMLADGDAPLTENLHINKVTTAIDEIQEGKVRPSVSSGELPEDTEE
ncbi:MAG: DNA-directed RNA polymerase subunit omega [Eubacteriaceae bacterium]|nr:DNA-directed RNA polymerase subunit omega [Eubacteriaceae bacterium]